MKRSISLWIFTLLVSLPSLSTASSIANQFLTSSTGTAAIDVSDTIRFEIVMTIDAGQPIDYNLWVVTGDEIGARASSLSSAWSGVRHRVSD